MWSDLHPPASETSLAVPKLVSPSVYYVAPPASNCPSDIVPALNTWRHITPQNTLPCRSWLGWRSSPCTFRYLCVSYPLPHLYIPITPFCLAMFDDLPHLHVHSKYVAMGQRFPSLLDHHYLWPKMSEHKMFPQPSCTMFFCGASRNQTSHWLKYTGEWHHVCGSSLPFIIKPPRLGGAYSM